MRSVVLGHVGRKPLELDLDVLLRTRLLIQAGSGGGKSWALRRLAEQLFGKVQVFLIDREGEFSTLREKYGYVLVGQDMDTPADVRSARQLAEKLLEINASAVCDLYEAFRSKPGDRRAWVRGFLEGVMDAPKKFWRDLVVIVDEAHLFAPQETPKAASMVEREVISGCKEAMIALATAGRKRGFCAVWATQRLAKLDKDASAELLNRVVGMTIEDVDVDRAADLMSVSRDEKADFKTSLKNLEPGNFYAFGRAISKERVLVRVGPVATTHPEPGSSGQTAGPPPPPEKVKSMLAKLADFPKEIETKAKTEAELRTEIRSLKAQLATRPTVEKTAEPKIVEKIVKIPAVGKRTTKAIQKIVEAIEHAAGRFCKVLKFERKLQELCETLRAGLMQATLRTQTPMQVRRVSYVHKPPSRTPIVPRRRPPPMPEREIGQNGDDGELTKPQLGLLRGMRELNQIGLDVISRPQLAGWLGKKVSGSLLNDLGRLRALGCVNYQDKDVVLTEEGLGRAPEITLTPTPEAIFEHVLGAVSGPQKEILTKCHEAFPEWVSREDLSAALGKQISGSFLNDLGRLRSAMMIEYGTGEYKKYVRLSAWTILAQEVPA